MAADWWSVGVMIFEMLGGLPTFRGQDLRQTYQKVLYADVVFTPEETFSSDARELLLGLIQRWRQSPAMLFALSDCASLCFLRLPVYVRRDPQKRLGSSKKRDVKMVPFFKDINWDDIYNR